VTKFDNGGNRITDLLKNFLAEEFKRKFRVDPLETKRGVQKLLTNAENIKHILSTLVRLYPFNFTSLYDQAKVS